MVKHILLAFFLYLAICTPSMAQSGIASRKVTEMSKPLFFPNPANGKLFLKADLTFSEIEIYDLSGNLRLTVKSFDEEFIDVSALKPSLYLIKIISSDGVNISKLTIKR